MKNRPKMVVTLFALGSLVVAGSASAHTASSPSSQPSSAATATTPLSKHIGLKCAKSLPLCTEVADSETVFGPDHYVGHDEPSVLFYSYQHGAGNQMQYAMTIPSDPSPTAPKTKSYNFELHPAFWFGMALCDTQSAPHPTANIKCTPNSDSNITTDAEIANHPGTAFMEMQFYPPGWQPFSPTAAGTSCDPTKWCAALNIDSLSIDYPAGQQLNDTCLGVTGIEPVNFAYITLDGVPQAPPNPINSTAATFVADTTKALTMNAGDRVITTMHDTAHGLRIDITDKTTGQHGFMVTSAKNGFGQVKFAPNPSTECTNIPYDFHPMYDTSSEMTRVPWAAHSYNIAFADETGHFDFCNGAINPAGFNECKKPATEGDGEVTEGVIPTPAGPSPLADDWGCGAAATSLLVKVTGCTATNSGFDGVPYQANTWPNGSPNTPTPITFTSPHFGPTYNHRYERVGLEADLPRIEAAGSTASVVPCDRTTGANCTLIPLTDDTKPGAPAPANFYPFFSIIGSGPSCQWVLGNDIPGVTVDNFGGNAQYGDLLSLTYPAFGGSGATSQRFNDFRNILANPCVGGH